MENITLAEESQNLIKQICREQNITNYDTAISSGSAKGDGYASKLYRIAISGTKSSGDNQTLHMILKTAPTSEKYRSSLKMEELFERETFLYQNVLPEFQKLQQEHNVPPADKFKSFCKYYGASMKHLNEVIALENLKECGFELWDRKTPMTYPVLKMVMQDFGRYHALSFALRDKKPNVYKQLADCAEDLLVPMMKTNNFTSMITKNMDQAKKALDPIKDCAALERFNKLNENAWDICENITKEAIAAEHSVLAHGDSWGNNMMFKFDKRGEPVEMCLLDWQLVRSSSPVLDLSYFLMANLTEASHRVDELLQEYHKSLSKLLQQLGCDPEKLFPYNVLKDHWKQFSTFGLIWASVIAGVMTIDTGEVPDFEKLAESEMDMTDAFSSVKGNEDKYLNIMKHAIYYCVENNII